MASTDPKTAWHSQPIEKVLSELDTQLEHGLSEGEAAARLHRYGPNELRERPRTPWYKRVVDQLNSFVVILLIVASVVSALLGDTIEAIVIMAIVVLNAVLGVVQEGRAEQALAALKKMAAPEAEIIRDGHRRRIPARELVPGDVVLLEAGNFVPADLRLIESVNLKIDESSLTGESVAVEKHAAAVLNSDIPLGDRQNAAYMSTTVTYGRGMGVVTGTGMQTQIGLIAQMIQSFEEEPTPLQNKLDELGRVLSTVALSDLRPGICCQSLARNQPRSHLRRQRRNRPIPHGLRPDHRRFVLDCGQSGDCRRAGGSAGRRHDQSGAGHARNDQTPRPDSQTLRRGNARFRHDDLLRQDRHADAECNDGGAVVDTSRHDQH